MTADEIISREIKQASAYLRTTAQKKLVQAHTLKQEADAMTEQALRQDRCDEHGTHQFREVKGTGMLGGRFEEKCKNCGWIHTS